MSLFEVARYLGGEEEDAGEKKQEASNILKRLQEEAKARKRSLGKEDVKNDCKSSERGGKTKAVLSTTVDNSPLLAEVNIEEIETVEGKETKSPKRKKKSKVKAESPVEQAEIVHENKIVEDDSFQSIKKKKKKRKHKLSDSEAANESLIETELITPVKKIKVEETLTADIETSTGSTHKKHKKHKKHKHKEIHDIDKEENENALIQEEIDEDMIERTELNGSKIVEDVDMEDVDKVIDDGVENEESDELDKEGKVAETVKGKNEIGGFTVIGNVRPAKLEKVRRVLPDWLSSPSIISADLTFDKLPVSEMPGLAVDLVDKLKENDVTHFFPVQRQVIPALLESSLTGFQTGRAGYRPSDICVSAPTGSGKTLAFVLPIVQALRTRVTCEVRALAVLPVRDLATQVFKVFQTYCKGTNLKVGLMIGQKTLLAEQQSLVKKRLRGYQSMFDIIVATPGRLVDHINKTEGLNLGQLRYLVIDEADRMMDEIKQDWLIQVESAVYRSRPRPGPLTVSSCQNMEMPLQKLLYSATLSQNPEKLQQLNLFQPKLFTSVVKAGKKSATVQAIQKKADTSETSKLSSEVDNGSVTKEETSETVDKIDSTLKNKDKTVERKNEEKSGDFVGKYATPTSLTEYYIETTSAEKPLIVLHLLHHLKYRNILCFTNSVEATHRLFMLIKLYGGIEVKELSSSIHVARRDAILQKFMAGKIDILVCSDAMARGMDITNVKYVISYDPPPYIQTYIHRIGRTARAGKEGTAFTLLQKKEFFHFKKMVREAGKANLSAMKKIVKADLKPLLPKYEETLKQLGEMLKNEKPKKKYTPRKLQKPEIKNKTG